MLKIASAGSTLFGARAVANQFATANNVIVDVATDHGHLLLTSALACDLDADIVMLPADMLDQLIHAGRVSPDNRVEIGSVNIGAAIGANSTPPDVSSRATLSNALLGADEILLTLAPTGEHMLGVINQLGMGEQLAGKTRCFDKSIHVNIYLLKAKHNALAFGPAPEILAWQDRGIQWAGAIAKEFQVTLPYSAVRLTDCSDIALADKFLQYLALSASRTSFAATGVT